MKRKENPRKLPRYAFGIVKVVIIDGRFTMADRSRFLRDNPSGFRDL